MRNIVKGIMLITFSFSSIAMANKKADRKKQNEKIVKEFTSNLKEVTPRLGNFSFVSCQENFALSSIDIGASAKLKKSVEIPFLAQDGAEQKIVIGSKDVKMDFSVFSDEKVAPFLSLDEIDLENMDFDCKKQEKVVYKTRINFSSPNKDYAEVSYTHPTIGTVKLHLEEFNGKAIKKGDDMYAAVKGTAKIETFDKHTNKIVYQDLEMLFRFHYNNAGDKPIFNMDAAQIAEEIKEKVRVPVDVVQHEAGRIKVIVENLNLREGPSVNYNSAGNAADTFDDDIFEVVARSGNWLNVEVNGKSLWMHGSTKYVQYLD